MTILKKAYSTLTLPLTVSKFHRGRGLKITAVGTKFPWERHQVG